MRNQRRTTTILLGVLLTAGLLVSVFATSALAITNQLVFDGQIGWEVNKTTKGYICLQESGDECQGGKESSEPGGFKYPKGAAVGPSGNVYISEVGNRVDEFDPKGEFIRMFGWDVNETKTEQGAATTQEEKNICTQQEITSIGVKCQAGQKGGLGGQFNVPVSIAIDPETGKLYIEDLENWRIDEYTENGEFVLTFGQEVNEAKDAQPGASEEERKVCTKLEKCKTGVKAASGSKAHAAFSFRVPAGNVLSVAKTGSPAKPVLYEGDEDRIQEFGMNGKWTGELSLAALGTGQKVKALAVAGNGEIYTVYNTGNVRVLNSQGIQVREVDPNGKVVALALDPFGRLAVEEEGIPNLGVLFDATSGQRLSEFKAPADAPFQQVLALAFNENPAGGDELYATDENQDFEIYAPIPVAELETTTPCGGITGSSLTFNGEVNPSNVNGTNVWFQYGETVGLGSSTALQSITTGNVYVPMQATVGGLLPNQTYFFRAAGEDDNAPAIGGPGKEPQLTGGTLECKTLILPPAIPAAPQVSEIGRFHANLTGEVNPEHAQTRYEFQYGTCPQLDGCATVLQTPTVESAVYGLQGISQTAIGLTPGATYRARLVAINEYEEETQGPETEFTTQPAPNMTATTGATENVTATEATLNGTVDPDEESATYSFQGGIYNAQNTVYSTILSGPVTGKPGQSSESFTLTGLQPGTTYAYRIILTNAYGEATGATQTFTTAGLPTVLFAPAELPQLAVPPIAFPKTQPTLTPKKLTPRQQLERALKACKRKPRKQRAACERNARKKHPVKRKKHRVKGK